MGQSSLLRFIQRLGATGTPCSLSDAELLDRYTRDEDKEAFSLLVRRHGAMVWNVCRRVLVREQDAEDAFQATFVVLAKKAATIAKPELLGAWLFGVSRRVALKARACCKPLAAADNEDPPAPHADPLAAISARELLHIVDEELAALPEVYRAPLILCCLEGKSRDEAARLLNWSAGSLKGRLERARQLLERRLTRRGITLSAALVVLTASSLTAGAAPPALISATVQTGLGAVAASPGVATLSTLACRTLFWESIRKWIFAAAIIGVIGMGVGSFVYPRDERSAEVAPVVPAPKIEPIAQQRALEHKPLEKAPEGLAKEEPITIEGALRNMDAGAGTITIVTGGDAVEGGGQVFRLAPDARIQTPSGLGQLADLARAKNACVQLRLSAERREVLGITILPRKKAPPEKGKG